jgi:hypothetical protein
MRHRTFDGAAANARANAAYFKVPWAVFSDTSGNWNSERWREAHTERSWSGTGPATRFDPPTNPQGTTQ